MSGRGKSDVTGYLSFHVTAQSGFVGGIVAPVCPRLAVAGCILGGDRDRETCIGQRNSAVARFSAGASLTCPSSSIRDIL